MFFNTQVIEFSITTTEKKQSKVKGNDRIKVRVIEIYYGFTDYIRGVTTGKLQQHSLSSRNAFAICKIEKAPFTSQEMTMNPVESSI
jgi:hypothetical protein